MGGDGRRTDSHHARGEVVTDVTPRKLEAVEQSCIVEASHYGCGDCVTPAVNRSLDDLHPYLPDARLPDAVATEIVNELRNNAPGNVVREDPLAKDCFLYGNGGTSVLSFRSTMDRQRQPSTN